jgi:KUP system potassium uptake protein
MPVMIITIIVVAAFKSSTALTNAYGFVIVVLFNVYPISKLIYDLTRFAVATVMFSTTLLISVQMRYVKHLAFIVPIGFFLIFGFFDGESQSISESTLTTKMIGLFWGAALKKIPEGLFYCCV